VDLEPSLLTHALITSSGSFFDSNALNFWQWQRWSWSAALDSPQEDVVLLFSESLLAGWHISVL